MISPRAQRRVGSLELGDIPRIAIPVSDTDLEGDSQALLAHADLLELRVDQCRQTNKLHLDGVAERAVGLGRPVIVTVRAPREGGQFDLTDEHRLRLIRGLLAFADAVDIEHRATICSTVIREAHAAGKAVIVSRHDFSVTSDDATLDRTVAEAHAAGADIVKIAETAREPAELERLLQLLLRHREKGLIVIAMGEHGAPSRVFFPLLGSLITYGFHTSANAPGQLSAADIAADLRRYSPTYRVAHG